MELRMKSIKLLFLCTFVLGSTVFGEANVILKIGGNEINADAIKLDNKLVSNLFFKKYHRLPGADDNELISKRAHFPKVGQ